jgi:MFS family permease
LKQYRYYFLHMERSMKIYIFMWSMVGFSAFGLQAVLLNLYMVHLGFNEAGIGQLLAVAQLCFGLAALPAGVIGARLGPRTGLRIGTAMVAAGWTLFLLAESVPAGPDGHWAAAFLQVGLAIANMGQATMIVNGAPYLMCITQDIDRFYYISFQQAIQALLGLVGSYIAGALPGILATAAGQGLSDVYYYRSVLWLIPVGFVGAFLSLLRARDVQLQVPTTSGSTLPVKLTRFPWHIFAFYMVIVYLAIVGDNGSRTFFNLYLKSMGLETSQIGAMFGFNQLAPFITALSIPAVLRRLGTGKTFSTGAILLGAVLLFLSFSSGLTAAGIGFFLMALMSTALQATRSLFGQELVESRWRTFIASSGTISMALGSASSSILGGYIIPTLGFPSLFRSGAVLVCLSGLLTLTYLGFTARSKTPKSSHQQG